MSKPEQQIQKVDVTGPQHLFSIFGKELPDKLKLFLGDNGAQSNFSPTNLTDLLPSPTAVRFVMRQMDEKSISEFLNYLSEECGFQYKLATEHNFYNGSKTPSEQDLTKMASECDKTNTSPTLTKTPYDDYIWDYLDTSSIFGPTRF